MEKKRYIKPAFTSAPLYCLNNYGLGTGSPNVDDPDDVLVKEENAWEDNSATTPTQKNLWDEEW